jgi:hypothetical protein
MESIRLDQWEQREILYEAAVPYAFAQNVGMPLAGPGKFDDLPGDDSVRKIVCKPKGCARHFKRDMENSLGFGIGVEVV